jgi:hypothetical protein
LSFDAPPADVVDVVDPDEEDDLDRELVVEVVDFGLVVVVVLLPADDFGRVVVVVDRVDPRAVVVVVDDLEVDFGRVVVVVDRADPRAVVVVVEDLTVDFGFVVVVVDAFGTFGSSLAGSSSRAWAGAPGAGPTAGDPGGGGIRSSRRAYCMIRAKTGADTWPP